jgi:hypothetical protein
MNHATDGNLAAIESHLSEQESDDNSGTLEEHRMLAKWLSASDEEKAEFYWQHPESIPDDLAGYAQEHWEGFMAEDKEDE